jgi:hypothetical protein
MPNTPVGSINENSNKLIKLKGNSAFPRKPSHPRGLLQGYTPPEKMVPFFRKIREYANYASVQALGKFRRSAGNQEEKMRETEIAYASSRIRPFSLASGPTGRL